RHAAIRHHLDRLELRLLRTASAAAARCLRRTATSAALRHRRRSLRRLEKLRRELGEIAAPQRPDVRERGDLGGRMLHALRIEPGVELSIDADQSILCTAREPEDLVR